MKLKTHLALLLGAFLGIAAYAEDKPAEKPPEKPLEEPKKSLWEHSIALGLTVTKGNSDTLTATVNWLSLKKWDKNEFRFTADGTYGESDGVKNAQSARGTIQYNRLFSERLFGYLRADISHDDIADIEYRFVLSPGVGYFFIKTAATQLSGEIGPGWVYENKGGQTDDFFTLRLAQRFTHRFNDRVRLWESVEYLPQVDDWGNFIVNAEIGVENALSKRFALRVFLQDTYTSRPAVGRKENDFRLVAALAYKL